MKTTWLFLRRRFTLMVGVALLFCVGSLGLIAGMQSREQVAFTVEYAESIVSPTSGRSLDRDLYWAFSKDGSFSNGDRGASAGRRRIVDFPGQREVVVSDSERMKVTTSLADRLPANARRRVLENDCAPPPNAGYRFVAREQLLGYETYLYELQTSRQDQSTETTRYWLAPELLCFELKTISTKRNALGEVTNVFQKTVSRVIQGEPDRRLFSVPDHYAEVIPSVFEKRLFHARAEADAGTDMARDAVARAPVKWFEELAKRDADHKAANRR